MKSFVFVALSVLIMAFVSYQADAATVNLGKINQAKDFGNTVSGSFSDTFTFQTSANNGIGVSATNVSINYSSFIKNFSGFLDGVALNFKSETTQFPGVGKIIANFLVGSGSGSGQHTLVISGLTDKDASYGGSIAVAQTPIPAAIWLFGSAAMGLMGMSRRKKA